MTRGRGFVPAGSDARIARRVDSVYRKPRWLRILPPAVLAAVVLLSVRLVVAVDITFVEDDTSGDFNLVGEAAAPSIEELDARIVLNYQEASGDHYVAALTGGKAKFYRVSSGQTTLIGTSGDLTPPVGEAETVPFTLQRRDWAMALVWNNQVIARAFDSTLPDGKAGTIANTGELRELFVQPVGDILAGDDFVREEGGVSNWEVAVGRWEQRSLRDDEQADRQEAAKSANAFSYHGSAADGKPAIATLGYWFWDAYSFQAAVKPADDGAVGLVLYFQDPDNYIAVRWLGRDHPEGGRLQIVVVHNGERSVVTEERGGFIPEQWYQMRAALTSGVIHVWIDDELRLVARTDALGQGAAGLYAESAAGAFFDDVACGPWELFVEDFSQDSPGRWVPVKGSFAQADGQYVVKADDGSLAISGRRVWSRYKYAVTVRPGNGGGCGLVVGYQSPADYCIVRWALAGPPYAGKAQVVRVKDGREQVLSEAPVTVPIKTWYRATAQLVEGLVSLDLEGRRQVEAFAPDVTEGAVGVFAQGARGTAFDNAVVEILPPKQPARITKEFADTSQHPEMSEWASTAAPWVKPDGDPAVWWTKGDYFGDHALVFTVPNVTAGTGTVNLLVGAAGPDDPDALKLAVATTAGSRGVGLTLSAGEAVVAEARVDLTQDQAVIGLERRAHWLVVLVNDAVAMQTDLRKLPEQAKRPAAQEPN